MSMTEEMLEMLIGKHLDGEITPSEQRILETELDENPQAKELLEQLQDLHQRSCELVSSEILGRGKAAEEIFEHAWRRQARHPFRPLIRMGGCLRFATGVAAGLLIGLLLHFVLPLASTPQNPPDTTNVFTQNTSEQMNAEGLTIPRLMTDPAGDSMLNVDWYSFTDDQGNQWLIEGLRENSIRPAVYYEGL